MAKRLSSSRFPLRCAALLSLLIAQTIGSALAAVKQTDSSGFQIELTRQIAAKPEAVFSQIGKIGQWWHPAHTWSGDAANMSLQLNAGGCFCERWAHGEAEHLRVVYVEHNTRIRMQGGLGPLQSMGLSGVLELALNSAETGTELTLSYRVSGDTLHQLETIAPAVDGVLGQQLDRLQRLLQTGSADKPAEADAAPN